MDLSEPILAPPSPASTRLYDLALFDFDGTLADSAEWVRSVFDHVAKRHRFRRVSDAEIEHLRGQGSREVIRYLGIPGWRIPLIARDMRRMSAAAADQITPFDGVTETLAQLHARGVVLGLVSSNGEATVRKVLGDETVGRFALFECGAAMFGKSRVFRRAARRVGVANHRTLCIGDETRDIEAAAQAGMASAAVAWGYASVEALSRAGPTHLVTRPDHLLRLF
jgi:phosphoglycolate phosphatase